MSKTIKTKLEYKKAVKELEKISDNPDFGDNPKDIIEYEALSNSIVEYQNLNFNILKMSNKTKEEIEQLAKELCNIPIDLVIDEEERYYKDFKKYDGIIIGYTQCQETLNARIVELKSQIESLTNKEGSCKEDKIELNDETVDSFINNYVKHLPDNWRTTLDMYLAMKNAMLESLSCPNKYLTPKNP